MRKIISICLLLALLISAAVCVRADGKIDVFYTGDSSFKAGGTTTVDIQKTAQSVLNAGGVTSDLYNAALEKNMDVMWRCSNGADKYGSPITWTSEDVGKEYVCRIGFYSDKACTQFVDYIDSDPFVVSAGQAAVDVKLTPEGPFYLTVGKYFEQQISCNVSGVTIENFRTSFPTGIDISSSGLISGTPTKEGFWYVTIAAYKDGEQIGDIGAEFYVSAAQSNEPPEITTKYLPEATVGESYYVKLNCTDPDASFGEWYNPGKANDLSKTGLILTQHGELEGKPTKAGTYSFCIYATGETGEGYMTYTLVVKEAVEETTDPAEETTEPVEETTADPTDAVTEPEEGTETEEPTETSAQEGQKEKDKNDVNIWIFVGIGLAILIMFMAVCIVVCIILLIKSKKKA